MALDLLVQSPLDYRHNSAVQVSTPEDVIKAVKAQVANLTDMEVQSMHFTIVDTTQNATSSFVFGVNRGNFRMTAPDIMSLAARNKYVQCIRCAEKGPYMVVMNYPRSLKKRDHATVPVEHQTTLVYGQPAYPVYSLADEFETPIINPGAGSLRMAFNRLCEQKVASR